MKNRTEKSNQKDHGQAKSVLRQVLYFLQRRDKNGFDSDGYDTDGFDEFGYNRAGYDVMGYDRRGFNKIRCHQSGEKFDSHGWDFYGYDKDGYNEQGLDKLGKTRADYIAQRGRMNTLLEQARNSLGARELRYAALDIRCSLEVGIRMLLNRNGTGTDDRVTLGKWISEAEYRSLLDPSFLKQIREAKSICDAELHESNKLNTHQAVTWAYYRAEELKEKVRV